MKTIPTKISEYKCILFIILVCFASQFYSQPTLNWAKGFGGVGDDQAKSVVLDGSGNVYSCGSFSGTAVDFDPGGGTFTLTSAGVNDAFISKLDNLGNFVWAKRIGGGSDEKAASISIDGSGNVYITGYFYGTVDFDPGAGTFTMSTSGLSDAFVLKLDMNGTFVWAKKLGGPKGEFGMDITIDANNNVYTTGQFAGIGADFDPGAGTFTLSSTGTNQNNVDVYISKLNSAGTFVWAKGFGGDSSDVPYNIVADPAGNVYTSGFFLKTPDFDPSPGTFTVTSVGSTDVFIHKLDAAGNFLFAKTFGGTQPDWTSSLALDNSGNIYSTGLFNGMPDFDPGPATYTMLTGGGPIYINKLSSTGNFVWAKQLGKNIGGSNLDHDCMTTDASGNLYIVGGFSGTNVDLDPGAALYSVTSATNAPDLFVDKIDPTTGNLIWCAQMGGAGTAGVHGNAIKVDAGGNVYAAGDFWGTTDFDPTPGTFNMTSNGYGDVFVLKLNQGPLGITNQSLSNDRLQIFPNPNNGEFTVNFNEDIELKVINELGEVVKNISLKEDTGHDVQLNDLTSGIYFIIGQNGKVSVKEKMIVIK